MTTNQKENDQKKNDINHRRHVDTDAPLGKMFGNLHHTRASKVKFLLLNSYLYCLLRSLTCCQLIISQQINSNIVSNLADSQLSIVSIIKLVQMQVFHVSSQSGKRSLSDCWQPLSQSNIKKHRIRPCQTTIK